MGLDIRKPIGFLLLLVGLQLVLFGLVSDTSLYTRSLGFNVNLAWGIVMAAAGSVFLALAWRSARR